ncbi:hypothetical protein KJ359_004005 [Pestalotiopsis sp. 9143b]|nr:hypothetical protein KJ359_004005 [Pestalotiopsis sp. 9143b]
MLKSISLLGLLAVPLAGAAALSDDLWVGPDIPKEPTDRWLAEAGLPEQLRTRDSGLEDRDLDSRGTVRVPVVANFNDRAPQMPLGTYRGLDFQIGNVKLGTGFNGQVTKGIIPKTPPNALGYGVVVNLGDPSPTITVSYANSSAVSFDLYNFWFGCALGAVSSLATPPVTCVTFVGGYDGTGKRVALQQSAFVPANATSDTAPMVQAVLNDGFRNLASAIFVTKYNTQTQLGVTLIDNVNYTVTART